MNDFYNASGYPAPKQKGDSAPARTEFSAIAAAFDKFPRLPGNAGKIVAVNASATGLEAVSLATSGTWTPSVGGTAIYGPNNTGRYIKIGNLVFIEGYLGITNIGTGQTFSILGLPFAPYYYGAPVTSGAISVSEWSGLATPVVFVAGAVLQTGVTEIAFRSATTASTSVGYRAIFTDGSKLGFSGFYFAA